MVWNTASISRIARRSPRFFVAMLQAVESGRTKESAVSRRSKAEISAGRKRGEAASAPAHEARPSR